MTELLKLLSEAASRGVDVTLVVGGGGEIPCLRFPWVHQEHWSGGIARYRAAGYSLYVQDMDGDGSVWELKRGREVLAEGSDYGHQPYYHFDACLLAAEQALVDHVRARLAELRGAR